MASAPPNRSEAAFSSPGNSGGTTIEDGVGAIATSVPSKSRNKACAAPSGGGVTSGSSAGLAMSATASAQDRLGIGRAGRSAGGEVAAALQRLEEAVAPGMDIELLQPDHHRGVAVAPFVQRYLKCLLQGLRDFVDIVRIDH